MSYSECDFKISKFSTNRVVFYEGETVNILASIKNKSSDIGTIYLRLIIADSYNTHNPIFDSHLNLSPNEKHSFRLVDLLPNTDRSFSFPFKIPKGLENRHFSIRLEVWNPHYLFNGPYPLKFDDSGWKGGFEVLSRSNINCSIFLSYSWTPSYHKEWVQQFDEELRKYNIETITDWKNLRAGENIDCFMENGITESDLIIIICSESFTNKANARTPGGVGTESIISANEYRNRTQEEKSRFIPVIRDNNLSSINKLPKYLSGVLSIDMSGDDWRGEPMSNLVQRIREIISKQ